MRRSCCRACSASDRYPPLLGRGRVAGRRAPTRRASPPPHYREVVAATNFKQRTRKMLEYHHADRLNYAVVGTPNRLEYDQGFFVKNGDGAADVKPIAHLYKTQVYAIAEALGVPEEIRSRPPTTDTYSLPQSQEEFYFSLPYDKMDLCLYARSNGYPPEAVADAVGLSAGGRRSRLQGHRREAPRHRVPGVPSDRLRASLVACDLRRCGGCGLVTPEAPRRNEAARRDDAVQRRASCREWCGPPSSTPLPRRSCSAQIRQTHPDVRDHRRARTSDRDRARRPGERERPRPRDADRPAGREDDGGRQAHLRPAHARLHRRGSRR